MEKNVLLKVRNVKQWFPVNTWFFEKKKYVKAVNDVSFDLYEGETLGIAGESGCGKSTLIRTCLRLLKPTDGTVEFEGKEIAKAKQRKLRSIRKDMQIIFQDPYASLDPRWTVRRLLEEPLIVNRMCRSKAERLEKVNSLLDAVSISREYINRYPHEFSGGQRQRIAIASALATDPKLVMCDEPVSALDVSVRAQVLNLLKELQEQRKLTYIFVSHDMSVIEYICDRVAIMEQGVVVESGNTVDVFSHPQQPITKDFIDTASNIRKIYDLIEDNNELTQIGEGDKMLLLTYSGTNAGEPLISYLSKAFDIRANIIYGNIDYLKGKPLGKLVVTLSGQPENVKEAINYIDSLGVEVEVIRE